MYSNGSLQCKVLGGPILMKDPLIKLAALSELDPDGAVAFIAHLKTHLENLKQQ